MAYTPLQGLKTLTLQETERATTTSATIRARLLAIGATVLCNTRRVRILLASHHPLRPVFLAAARALAAASP
jgi:hypothetical protein